jgi:hypothetical protein
MRGLLGSTWALPMLMTRLAVESSASRRSTPARVVDRNFSTARRGRAGTLADLTAGASETGIEDRFGTRADKFAHRPVTMVDARPG